MTAARSITRIVAGAVVAAAGAVLLPLGVAHAADADWAYVAQYENRETCEMAAGNYRLNGGVGDGGEWRCISNGNPASDHETWALYQVWYR